MVKTYKDQEKVIVQHLIATVHCDLCGKNIEMDNGYQELTYSYKEWISAAMDYLRHSCTWDVCPECFRNVIVLHLEKGYDALPMEETC